MPAAPSGAVAPRGWVTGLAGAVLAAGRAGDVGEAAAVAESFAARLPPGYFERTAPATAAADLAELEALAGSQAGAGSPDLRMAVQPDPDPGAGMFRLRLYSRLGVVLSSFLPVLDSFGLIVVEAVPHRVEPGPAPPGPFHIDDFGLRAPGPATFDPAVDGRRLVDAVSVAWDGDMAVDTLNRLVVSAGLDRRQTMVLRAYRRYRRQAGTAWSDRQLEDPLVAFPDVTRALVTLFAARFDPAGGGRGETAAHAEVLEALTAVERLDQDQVLRGYLGLVEATVRTNYYREGAAPALALKLDSTAVPELPSPRPCTETFVFSPRVEGLHLRGGPIARGGIRWSDRQDDLRTEVLDLARAQVLKNAIIVPTGAKGGFVCRRLAPGADRPADSDGGPGRPVSRGLSVDRSADGVASEVRWCYETFIGALLDVTDNVVGGRVERPAGVRALDGDDPYLVVAADRGTAALSDVANQLSLERGFWLGDAFASGGSHGYDHKAMGITARGAWTVVRQHFRQLGIDPEAERIRVVGVGDMSGDVFGNGMLQSRTLALIAAFDHRDIFIDPDPDPAVSFDERLRLARLPASSWQDYDRRLLSPGGGVWSRTAKEVRLSPEARRALGVTAEVLTPPEVVSAILTAAADLLWLGGIGTFVKATTESDADAADHADDRVRVDADRVRARVVAEGGNLGFTQRARIQYSRRGGKINTDFIDNAAGVATSDREVNLKVLLALAVDGGRLTPAGRDDLLRDVTGDVAGAVLRLVGHSAAALARAVPESAADIDAHEALMAGLEARGHLDRKVEALPDAEEIATRRAAGAGLIRPELAVLAAHAKSELAAAVEASALAAAPSLRSAVEAYFPPAVTARFGDLIGRHPLYAPLAATVVAGEIVDRMGVTWAHETAEECGRGLADVAGAYWAARQVTAAERRWRLVENQAPSVDADTDAFVHAAVVRLVGTVARRYLRRRRLDVEAAISGDRPVAGQIESALPAAGAAPPPEVAALVARGLDAERARAFAGLTALARVAEVGAAARATGRPVLEVAGRFDTVDQVLGLPLLEARLAGVQPSGRWPRWQLRILGDDIAGLRRQAVEASLARPGPDVEAVESTVTGDDAARAHFDRLLAQFDEPGGEALALGALAVRALGDLVTGGTEQAAQRAST